MTGDSRGRALAHNGRRSYAYLVRRRRVLVSRGRDEHCAVNSDTPGTGQLRTRETKLHKKKTPSPSFPPIAVLLFSSFCRSALICLGINILLILKRQGKEDPAVALTTARHQPPPATRHQLSSLTQQRSNGVQLQFCGLRRFSPLVSFFPILSQPLHRLHCASSSRPGLPTHNG